MQNCVASVTNPVTVTMLLLSYYRHRITKPNQKMADTVETFSYFLLEHPSFSVFFARVDQLWQASIGAMVSHLYSSMKGGDDFKNNSYLATKVTPVMEP